MKILSLMRKTTLAASEPTTLIPFASAVDQQTYAITFENMLVNILAYVSDSIVGGADTQIQFNNNGVFDGSPNFVWDYNTNELNVTGNISAQQIACSALNGVEITSAGVATNYLNESGSYSPITISAGGSANQVQFNNAGVLGGSPSFTWNAGVLTVVGSVNGTNFNGVVLTTGGSATQFLNGAGNYVAPPLTAAGAATQIQFNTGGLLSANPNLTWNGSTLGAPSFNSVPLSAAGLASTYLNGAGAYTTPPDTVVNPAGANTELQFNNAGVFGASASLTWNGTTLNATQFNGVALTALGAATDFLNAAGNYVPVPPVSGDMLQSVYDSGNVQLNVYDKANATGIDQIPAGTILTPPILIANVDDYNPAGFDTNSLLRMESDIGNNYRVTGFVAPPAGVNRIITITNIGTNGDRVDLRNNDAGSLPANRMLMRGNINLQDDRVIQLWYDHVDLRWRVLSEGT